jgi:hypothetical protein
VPVNGVSRLENADCYDHRLTVYRLGMRYRAYLDGRMLGLGRSKETAMAAAEWAAIESNAESLLPPRLASRLTP